MKGTLAEDDDGGDAYGVKYNPGDTVEIIVTPGKGLDVALQGADGGFISKNDGLKGESETIKLTTDIISGVKKFHVGILPIGGIGDYTLKITKTSQNDGNSGKDASGGCS
ncbi:MAG: hypothetical protein EFT35_05575 [Methanophagales archaeon ANME-1-THS]|nr:MAG: hypothetical protein EFT35_05575 [Methanophagales archaeon ANME-1-THS]